MRADYFLSLFVEVFLSGLHIGISRLRLQTQIIGPLHLQFFLQMYHM